MDTMTANKRTLFSRLRFFISRRVGLSDSVQILVYFLRLYFICSNYCLSLVIVGSKISLGNVDTVGGQLVSLSTPAGRSGICSHWCREWWCCCSWSTPPGSLLLVQLIEGVEKVVRTMYELNWSSPVSGLYLYWMFPVLCSKWDCVNGSHVFNIGVRCAGNFCLTGPIKHNIDSILKTLASYK